MTTSLNRLLEADSYKFSQFNVLPDGVDGAFSYIEARVKGKIIVPFGISMWMTKFLSDPITQAEVDEAEAVCSAHGEPFNKTGFQRIIDVHDGYFPVTIKGLPEGMPVSSSTPIYTIEAYGEDSWCASFIETTLQRAIWYPSTIASIGREMRKQAEWFYEHYSDNPGNIGFQLNDFGARGVSSRESAEIGGCAHLVNFMGTDNIQGILAARMYYGADMAGYSVPASEHSVQCAYGRDNQRAYLKKMLDTYAKPGGIVSIVLDGYDVYREAGLLCTEFKEQIIASGAKVVFRPDSGDMFEVVPRLLKMQESAFGFTMNSKGKKVINNVGAIQGDGIDSTTFGMLMQRVVDLGYAPECVVMGSGGGLLQKVNRDTYSFAQKTSAIRINGEWIPTVKDPITDSGKKSKGGYLTDARFITMYEDGMILYRPTFDEVRSNAK
jgi:nicotinamide phosphoribosyltransferase